MKPLISVIVPVHNVESCLGSCVESILSQTYKNLEVILINDGSIDGSGPVCEKYAAKDERVHVIHMSYKGVSAARNAGIKAAKGKYIGFVDGDDYIKADMLEKLYLLAEKTKSDISICKLGREVEGKIINDNGETVYSIKMDNLEAMRELFKGKLYRFSLCNKLFKRACFHGIQFPEGRIHEDLSTTYQLFTQAEKAVFTNYAGYIYVKRENSILTSKFSERRLDALIAWKEILPFMKEKYPLLYKEVVTGFGYWAVDNLYYIQNQVEDSRKKKDYLKSIQETIRYYYKDLMQNSLLSVKYKFILTSLNYHTDVFILMENIKTISRIKRVKKRNHVTEV